MLEKALNYEKVAKEFERYLESFDLKDKHLLGKKQHSYAVASLCEQLARRLSFTKDEIELAKIIGLLHDIGRFPQLSEISCYNDQLLDHAVLAIDYLFKKNMHIEDFIDDRFYDEIIRKSIYYHNKKELPKESNPVVLKFMKLIRDADKIDIFYQVVFLEKLSFSLDITPEVLKSYREGRVIENALCVTPSDSVLSLLAFLFDINYEESYDLLFETDNLGLFLGIVEVNSEAEELWKEAKSIAYAKLEGGVSC